jgi:hypothetical protein
LLGLTKNAGADHSHQWTKNAGDGDGDDGDWGEHTDDDNKAVNNLFMPNHSKQAKKKEADCC